MASKEAQQLEQQLEVQLLQLRSETEMFQRLMYKNKNQHRRCLYYRALSKVRRDLRLFETADLKNILNKCFQIIGINNPAQTVNPLGSLKSRKRTAVGEDLKRLLGVARLLAQMTEPIIEAGLLISTLLGQTFFMPFALAMLALLARLRVLLQQTLHDVVCVFNIVSSISQDDQYLKLIDEGLKVFRDHYPSHKPPLSLECHWDGVKFCLLEKHVERKRNIPEMVMDAAELKRDSYYIGKERRGPATSAAAKNKKDATDHIATHIRKRDTNVNKNTDHGGHISLKGESSKDGFDGNDILQGTKLSNPALINSSRPLELNMETKRKVDFISVNSPPKTNAKAKKAHIKLDVYEDDHSATSPSAKKSSDPLFNLLFVENRNGSVF